MYAAESVTGGPAVLNSVSCVAHLPQSLVRLLNHFIQQFFGRTPRLRAILSSCLWIFPDSFSGTEPSARSSRLFVAPGHFSAHQEESLYAESRGLEGACVNFALFRLGLLSSKNCTCCSFQPSQLSNVAQANQYFCSGVRGFSGVPTHRTCMAFHNQSHCSLSLLSTHEKGRGNHCLCWPIQRILS